MLIKIACRSLWNRRITALMTLLTLTISLSLLFSINHIRHQAKESFTSSVSAVDLIVGARSGQLNLLLYAVFRVGNPTNNISWESYQHIRQHRQIEWTVPISLGDSHRGYRVIGTSRDYFQYLQFADRQSLQFLEGQPFTALFDVVLGAEVARKLNYQLGDKVVISHGAGSTSFIHHDEMPFTVTGILAPTGTPVDKSLHVSLEAIEAIHLGWQHGVPIPGQEVSPQQASATDLTPDAITAFFVGMKSRVASFAVQRQINSYRQEPLTAILPGVALGELWQMIGGVERLLLLVSYLVLFAAFAGLITTLLASMKERQREIAVLRATGARPAHVFWLLQAEVAIITLTAIALSWAAVRGLMVFGQHYIAQRFGVFISQQVWQDNSGLLSLTIFAIALLVGCVPALLAYRQALSSSLAPRV
ncbi:ABC transporter permease [Aliidiomarina soli]|uniref:Peptide ABC transporter permease n=1 Tax=Aliidiomarina soli TaxID=1928574 RepID=A0A432WC20_9GAMM|nr:ABC transporter permease [Aliidiomarina soli]RUO29603.1 peptide ABC transporter permease [Aliidiomarina soli]